MTGKKRRWRMERRRGGSSAFDFDPLSSDAGIDAYLRECWKTGDEQVIRDGEFLAAIARERLSHLD